VASDHAARFAHCATHCVSARLSASRLRSLELLKRRPPATSSEQDPTVRSAGARRSVPT
jgi:hypothetical protein